MINILVVDHAAETSCCTRNLLPEAQGTGFKVDFTTCYRDILEGFRSNDYDVCLIDSATGNGPRLFAQARSLGFGAPIVLVTSNDAREALNAIRRGAADCLIRDDLTAAGIERSICCVVEQARASFKQSERERRYLALIDNAVEIIYTHDLQGNFTSMNPAGEQLIGYSQTEWLSLAVAQIVGPAYRGVVQQMIQETMEAQRQTFCAIEIVTKQGQSVPVEVGSHLIYHQGKAVEVQWIARNLSAPNQYAAARLRNTQLQHAGQSGAQTLAA